MIVCYVTLYREQIFWQGVWRSGDSASFESDGVCKEHATPLIAACVSLSQVTPFRPCFTAFCLIHNCLHISPFFNLHLFRLHLPRYDTRR